MTWVYLLLFLGAAAAAYLLVSKGKKAKPPDVTYVCDVCGDRDCDCREVKE
jgi:hypothetical protein